MPKVAEHDPDDHPHGPLTWDAVRVVTVATLTLVAVAVTALTIYLVSYAADQRRILQCLQVQVAELQASITTGQTAGRSDRQAQRELLLSDPADARAARQRYLDRLDEADRTRSSVPAPTRTCL